LAQLPLIHPAKTEVEKDNNQKELTTNSAIN